MAYSMPTEAAMVQAAENIPTAAALFDDMTMSNP